MTGAALDARGRAQVFAELEARSFDLAVIGGGITGAGIARDAAMRGLSVALVEARDYASGTSSRSSKMIHGGLRYLAQGDIALVKEAASERQILRRIAPHLTRLSPFLIPTTNMAMTAKLRTGLWTFEKLGGVPEAEKHEVIGLAELQRREPLMRTDGLNGAVLYPEFLTDDARLVLANVRSAQGAGAVAINHAAASELTGDGLVATSTLD
ncbi:MAG: FAD-dependent oxidoreductase, partial [Sphingopyxis sp.]